MSVESTTQLQHQHALLETLHGQLPQGVAVCDADLRLVYANVRWLDFLEQAVGTRVEAASAGTRAIDLLPEIDDRFGSAVQRAQAGETVHVAGLVLGMPNDEKFWDVTLAPVVEGGQITGLISVADDATARVVAERGAAAKARLAAFRADVSQALASSDDIDAVLQSCAEAMVRHAPAAFARIWVLDEVGDVYRLRASAGLYTRLNGTYSRIPADWIRQKTFSAYEPSMAINLLRTHQVREPDWASEQGLVAWASHPLVARGHVVGFMVMFARQNFDDDTLGELAAVADAIAQFLERKHAEDILREREILFRGVFESAADGLIITDMESGEVLAANPAISQMHDYPHAEFTTLRRTDYVHPDSLDTVHNYIATIQAGSTARVQAVNIRKDGTSFPVEVQGSPILYQGRPAMLGVVRDITREQEAHQLLERRVAERTRELQTLLEISRTITLAADLDPLFDLIFDQLRRLVDYESVSIGLVEQEWLTMVAVRRDAIGAGYPSSIGNRFLIDRAEPVWRALATGRTLYTPDIYGDDEVARGFRVRVGDQLQTTYAHVRSWVAAPLVVQHEFIGSLFISSARPNRYQQHDIDLAAATANQVAVAIQNARLHGQARTTAALEERQRLARELHDSVSQALFGICLGAETAKVMLERDPATAAAPIDYVLQLARGGMAEMRALIFELRPESLEQEGLAAALEKQAAATQARHAIAVKLSLCAEPDVSLEIKETLYRIAQEAMHNTVKHARASTIELRLVGKRGRLELDVIDDGRGFDAGESFPGHLGLVSMQERVERLGGDAVIESAPGKGTRVHVTVPLARGMESRKR